MSHFQSNGITLHFETWGEGEPLIIVHGWGSSTQGNWIDTGWVKALAPYRQVIGLDCAGHGKSDKPHIPSRYSYAALAQDVISLMDHLEIDRADFMGYSMGAFMGAALLGTDSARFSSFILGGIGNETPQSEAVSTTIAAALRASSIEAIENPAGRAYRRFVESDPDSDLEALAVSALQMWPEGFPLKVAGDNINEARRPVLIVNGSDDLPYALSNDELVAGISCAELCVLPGADHLSAVRNPDFRRAVIDFLSRTR